MFRNIFLAVVLALCTVHMTHAQIIVGHRGASYDAPENTLSAFRLAFEQQADGIEGDFYYTADRQLVCIHDADTLRTTGIKKLVAESTLEELRKLDYGTWKSDQFANEPIPTFRQVFDCVPNGKFFVIELKTGPEIVPLLKEELSRIDVGDRQLLIIAFDAATVKACKEQLPAIKAHWLTSFKNEQGSWRPSVESIVETVKSIDADGVGMKGERQVVNETFLEQLRHGGVHEFHVWTIDSEVDAAYFRQLGALGITTNRPKFIRDAFEASAIEEN